MKRMQFKALSDIDVSTVRNDMIALKPGERIDDLHRKGYRIIQHEDGFCFGMDAVLLTDFVEKGLKMRKPAKYKILDMGTGTGIIPILLAARGIEGHITAIDIQQVSVDMAKRSVELNHLEHMLEVKQCDVVEATTLFQKASFDVIVTNPPYMAQGNGLQNPGSAKAIARHEVTASLKQWLKTATELTRVNGRLFMVHRPHRLTEIMSELDHLKMMVKRMRFVHPYEDKPANMVLIEAVRQGNAQVSVERPLIIYKDKYVYHEEIYDIYGYEKPVNP